MEKKVGRNFDEYESGRESSKDIEFTTKLLDRLKNLDHVLENAALTAALMFYLHNKLENYNSILFYYVIRKYEKLNETKNNLKNYSHIHMEMFSVFVHPKSILNVPIKDAKLFNELKDTINITQYTTTYNKASKYIMDQMLHNYLQKFKTYIEIGLEIYSFENKIYEDMDRRKELSILESLHELIRSCLVRIQKVRCLPSQSNEKRTETIFQDFQITCTVYSLNIQLEYFRQSRKYSYLLKAPQNKITSNSIFSMPCQSNFKKHKIKGHAFQESGSSEVVECMVCDNILWGAYPQGLMCNNCGNSIHKDCKDMTTACHGIKKVKTKITEQKSVVMNKDPVNEDYSKSESNVSNANPQLDSNGNKLNEAVEIKQIRNDLSLDVNSSTTPSETQSKAFFQLTSFKKYQDSKKSNIKSTKSLTNTDLVRNESDLFRSKSTRTPSPEKYIFTPNRSTQDKLKLSDSDYEMSGGYVSLEPLIISSWELDEEMNVSETFEPEIELKSFSNYNRISVSKNSGAYSRLLVIMEFHHKTKFIRMILKRFKYLLVDRWQKMGDFLDLFDSLGLNCIDELYRLMKSLVQIMDQCKLDVSYHDDIAKNVYNWLTDKNDENLLCWLRLSMDLCCTNVLNSIKTSWIDHKKIYPKLNDLLSVEFNRLIIIEQLANMRPFLFNLPMIVSKIVKDLNRFPKYEDEALIWEEVYKKLIYLPKFLDERCMPVVELVNNGTIVGSTLKYKRSNRETKNVHTFEKFINNFPKSIFKETFIDFQFVAISNLRELHSENSKVTLSSVYTKEEIEAAAICYENKMIILQKENEKYTLKKFKSINQNKLDPWISFDQVHVTKRTFKETKNYTHELSILLIDVTILVQILFKEEASRDMWFDHVAKKTKKCQISTPSMENPILTDIACHDFEKQDNKTDPFSKLICDNLENVSNNLTKTLDLIFEGTFKDCNKDEKSKKIIESGPSSPNEFLLYYVHLLNEYALLGVQMIEESYQIKPQILIHQDIIPLYKNRLIDINVKMDQLTEYKEQSSFSIFSQAYEFQNEDSKISVPKKTFNSIQEYIEEIISQVKDKLVLESKYLNEASSKLVRQNAETENDS